MSVRMSVRSSVRSARHNPLAALLSLLVLLIAGTASARA
jgi:hypothetical protein